MLHLLARPLLEITHVPLPLVLERALTPARVIGAMAYFCSSSNLRILTQRRVRVARRWQGVRRRAAADA